MQVNCDNKTTKLTLHVQFQSKNSQCLSLALSRAIELNRFSVSSDCLIMLVTSRWRGTHQKDIRYFDTTDQNLFRKVNAVHLNFQLILVILTCYQNISHFFLFSGEIFKEIS